MIEGRLTAFLSCCIFGTRLGANIPVELGNIFDNLITTPNIHIDKEDQGHANSPDGQQEQHVISGSKGWIHHVRTLILVAMRL